MKKLKKNDNCEMVAYRFYGIPSRQDAELENKTFGCCRSLWNRMLADHNELYRQIGTVPQNTPADYKDLEECSWLNEVDSLALANVQINQDTAFSRFFKKEARYPKFKSKKSAKKSYTTNAVYQKKKDGTCTCNIVFDSKNGLLKLPKHKDWIQLRMHREIQDGGKLKSVTVTLGTAGSDSEPRSIWYFEPADEGSVSAARQDGMLLRMRVRHSGQYVRAANGTKPHWGYETLIYNVDKNKYSIQY